MGIQKMKVLTGTTLSLLISAVSAYPAIARPVGELESEQLTKQMQMDRTGQPMNQQMPMDRTGQPGTQMQTEPTGQPSNQMPTDRTGQPSNQMPTGRSVTGTVRSVDGDTVTLEMPDGRMQDIKMKPGDISSLRVRPGRQITATLDDKNMASNVSLIFGSPDSASSPESGNRVNTIRREEEVIERRTTVDRVPASTPRQTTPAPQQRVQSAPAEAAPAAAPATEQPVRPVRALW